MSLCLLASVRGASDACVTWNAGASMLSQTIMAWRQAGFLNRPLQLQCHS